MYKHDPEMSKILVIEDDVEFNATLCKMLKKNGYGVVRALTGRDGLDLANENPVDLVITDILLPDRDGVHVILDLKKSFPGIKIIAISGGGQCASGEEYLNDIQLLCNVEHVLAKPFHKNQLFAIMHEILD